MSEHKPPTAYRGIASSRVLCIMVTNVRDSATDTSDHATEVRFIFFNFRV